MKLHFASLSKVTLKIILYTKEIFANGILAKRQDEHGKILFEEKEKMVKVLFDKLGNNILIATGTTKNFIGIVDTIVKYGIPFTVCMISYVWIPERLTELLKEQ